MATSPPSYLQRRSARLAYEDLKKHVIFGLVISTIALGIGAWNYYFALGGKDLFFRGLMIAGVAGWAVALILPSLWASVEKATGFFMRKVGAGLFAVLLTLFYGVMIVPVGVVLRRLRGSVPIAMWNGPPPNDGLEGWRSKDVVVEAQIGQIGKASLPRRFIGVLQFFLQRKLYVFLPALVALLALGMALFFVKTSALAPFIYTLF
jgi:hypothetical protein